MTDVVDAATTVEPINHWISGAAYAGPLGPLPGRCSIRRRVSRQEPSTSRPSRRSTWRSRLPGGRCRTGARCRWRGARSSSSRSASSSTRRREEIAKHLTAEHGKVLSDALGEVTRGLEVIEFCCGIPHLLKGGDERTGFERRRRLLDPPAARRRRGHHAVQLPGDGPDVDVGAGARLREHVRAQAVGEGSVGVALHGRAAQGGRSARRCVQRDQRRQGRRRRAPRASGRRGRLLRRLDTDREVRLRDRHREREALPGARRAPRTTWSCCPTPTSRWRPMQPSRRRTARQASAAWRCRCSSPSATSPTRWSRRSSSGSRR